MKEVLINGRWPLILPDHRADRPEWLIQNGGWEAKRLGQMSVAIKPGHTVFYVGAEEGDMVALVGKWVGKTGTVVMFEPNEKVWPNIKLIWEANEVEANREHFAGFAADTSSDDAYLHISRKWPDCAYGEVIGNHGFLNLSERPDVPRITLDDFGFAGTPPDVISIDTEGSELRVLKGARQMLQEHSPEVFVSVHDAFMHAMYDEYAADLFKYMKDLGYEFTLLDYSHELHVHFWKLDERDPFELEETEIAA